MSDARWIDVFDDVAATRRHFSNALSLHSTGRFDDPGIDGYRDSMALMHAMQAGYTSAEAALLRILRILGEQPPSGDDWHRKLIDRLSRRNGATHARPALLSPGVAADMQEMRRFRHRAMRVYDDFDASRAVASLAAAERLSSSLRLDIESFKALIDPD